MKRRSSITITITTIAISGVALSALFLAAACDAEKTSGTPGSKGEHAHAHAEGEGDEHEEHGSGHGEQPDEHAGGEHAEREKDVVTIDPEMLRDLRITTARAESHGAGEGASVLGELRVDEDAYAEVGSPIAAGAVRMLVAPGDRVKPGDALVELESVELGKARADAIAANARRELASQALARKRALADQQIAPRREVEEAEAEARAAEAMLRAAEATLRAYGIASPARTDTEPARNSAAPSSASDSREPQSARNSTEPAPARNSTEPSSARDARELAPARSSGEPASASDTRDGRVRGLDRDAREPSSSDSTLLSSRFILRAPIAGTVIERDVVRGRVADPAKALFRIADLSRLWLNVHAFERDAVRVKTNTYARISLPALPGRTFTGTVARIGSEVDLVSRTIPVRIAVANTELLLRPGMSASAWLPIGDSGTDVVAVPAVSLQRVEDGWNVFIPKQAGVFEMRAVGRGRDLGGEVEILSGLRAGETVVVEGAFLLKAEAEKAHGEGEHHHH